MQTKSVLRYKDQAYLVYGFDDLNVFGLQLGANQSLRSLQSILESGKQRLTTTDFLAPSKSDHTSTGFVTALNIPKSAEIRRAKTQIVSGNIGIDFTNPLYEGSFNVLKFGKDGSGKVRDLLDSLTYLNQDHQFVLFSFARHDLASQALRKNALEILPASDSKEDTLKAISVLFHVLNEFKLRQKRVVLYVDDAVSLFYRLFNIYHFYRSEVGSPDGTRVPAAALPRVRNVHPLVADNRRRV